MLKITLLYLEKTLGLPRLRLGHIDKNPIFKPPERHRRQSSGNTG